MKKAEVEDPSEYRQVGIATTPTREGIHKGIHSQLLLWAVSRQGVQAQRSVTHTHHTVANPEVFQY